MLYLFVSSVINKTLNTRSDGLPSLPYLRARDEGVIESNFSFRSGKYLLNGSKYYLDGNETFKALIVVFHGMGNGRISYMKEICELAKRGYLVYAYDNTGCGRSEGIGLLSMGQALADQIPFFEFLDQDPMAKGLTRYAFGHSWGGYAAVSSLRENSFKIEKAISLAGIAKPSDLMTAKNMNAAFLKAYIAKWCRRSAGGIGDFDASEMAKVATKPILYIQSIDDPTVPYELSGARMKEAAKANPLVNCYFVNGKGHSPYASEKAIKHITECFNKGLGNLDSNSDVEMDVSIATEEDPFVMNRIFDFLDK